MAAETEPGELPPSISATSMGSGNWSCTFRFKSSTAVQTVHLAGTFNEWSRDATPMTVQDGNGPFSASVVLPSGRHQYKFVVNGNEWIADPLNRESDASNHGNSVLRLGRLAHLEKSDGMTGDGRIDAAAIEHENLMPLYFQTLDKHRTLIRLRTLANDVQSVTLTTTDGQEVPMPQIAKGPIYSFYEAEFTRTSPAGSAQGSDAGEVMIYTFVLTDGDSRVTTPFIYKRQRVLDSFTTPEWAKHAVWYQIMVDRFRNGNKENDPPNAVPWTHEWFTLTPAEKASGQSFYKFAVFHRLYGGDLQGVMEKLPYLKELGINVIYFNPVFKAASHHKYDATNYLHIDDYFGTRGDYESVAASEDLLDPKTWKWTETDKLFLELIRKAHESGIRVVIDGVFNHVGTEHPAFLDVKKNGKASRFADWFDVTSWDPFKYQGWAGHDSLPVFKKSPRGLSSDSCIQHIFNVTRRWMDPNGDGDPSDGIDGWRLDVPNEIPMAFWAEWRNVVKSVNPEAYTTGEIWDRADAWLDGRHFDAVMNYPFARATCDWIFNQRYKIKPSEIDNTLGLLRIAYPAAVTYVMQNLMDSHDTDRVVSMAFNPDRKYDDHNRTQDNGPDYNNAKPTPDCYKKARLAALLQMTYVGAPMVYYGDEVGMWGADDPTCRKPMLWEDLQPYEKPEENFVMNDHLDFYRRAIALRNAHSALRTGSFQTLLADDDADVWAFFREDSQEQIIVALNASNRDVKADLALPDSTNSAWTVVWGEEANKRIVAQNSRVAVSIPALDGIVLQTLRN